MRLMNGKSPGMDSTDQRGNAQMYERRHHQETPESSIRLEKIIVN